MTIANTDASSEDEHSALELLRIASLVGAGSMNAEKNLIDYVEKLVKSQVEAEASRLANAKLKKVLQEAIESAKTVDWHIEADKDGKPFEAVPVSVLEEMMKGDNFPQERKLFE